MDTVTYYNPLSGKIEATYSGLCLGAMDEVYPDCERVDGTYEGGTHYVLDGEPTERPVSPVTLVDLTLRDVPAGSKVVVDGAIYEAEGNVDLEFPLPGTYLLSVICFPYLDWEGSITI